MNWAGAILVSFLAHGAILLSLKGLASHETKIVDVSLFFEEIPPSPALVSQNAVTSKDRVTEQTTSQPKPIRQSIKKTSTPSATSEPGSIEAPSVSQSISGNSGRSKLAVASYEQLILSSIEASKRYPRSAQKRGIVGTAFLSIVIGDDGELISSELSKSSGFEILDSEVIAMAKRAAPFPSFPSDLEKKQLALLIPVEFQLN